MNYVEFLDKADELGFFPDDWTGVLDLNVDHDDYCDLPQNPGKECTCNPNIYMMVEGKRVDLLIDGELAPIMSLAYKL